MPSKDYRIWLSDKAFVVVEFVMVNEDYIRNYLQN
jgi:hypothetical protein